MRPENKPFLDCYGREAGVREFGLHAVAPAWRHPRRSLIGTSISIISILASSVRFRFLWGVSVSSY